MSLLPGVDALKGQLEAQNTATSQHRQWEGETLLSLKEEAQKIRGLAEKTNGRVDAHDVELGVIHEAERQAAIIQAAKVKADAELKSARITFKQGLIVATATAVLSGLVLAVLYLTGVA